MSRALKRGSTKKRRVLGNPVLAPRLAIKVKEGQTVKHELKGGGVRDFGIAEIDLFYFGISEIKQNSFGISES